MKAKKQHDPDICRNQRAAAAVGRVKNGFGKKVDGRIPDDSWQNLIASWHTYPHEVQSQLILNKTINRRYCKLGTNKT